MSLPWNKVITLCIGHRAVRGTLSRAWSPHIALNQCLCPIGESAIDPGDSAYDSANPDSVAAIQMVLTTLAQGSHAKAAHLKVLVTNSLMHFDVVSGDFGAARERDLQAIARACVVEMLGERAVNQVIRWQLQPGDRHLLISSMNQSAVDAMVQIASQYRMALVSLQPEFGERWNLHASSLSGSLSVFASVDDRHAIVCFVNNGAITALSHGPAPIDESASTSATGSLDERTDRLLASVGQDASALTSFVLVAPEDASPNALPRWNRSVQAEEHP